MKHIIITGHSRGLGAGIAVAAAEKGVHIHGISRKNSSETEKKIRDKGSEFSFYSCDLSVPDAASIILETVFKNIGDDSKYSGIYLVNNAGMINPIGSVEKLDPKSIDTHLRLNLLAPILLSSAFVRLGNSLPVQKRILNISSGAAVNPYHGWSIYCTAKAGLDMFTKTVGVEQKDNANPTEIMAIAPGIIDTDMQTEIRSTPDGLFFHKNRFIELKEKGQLVNPETAGKKLVEILFSNQFENGGINDIRNLY